MTDPNLQTNSADEELDLLPLLLMLWSRKYLLLFLLIAGACVGALLFSAKTPLYKAESLIQLETKNSGLALSEDIAELMSSDSETASEIEILKSRMVLGETVENLGLDVIATPKLLPLAGNTFFRLGLKKPDWGWLDKFGWGNDSISIDLLEVPASSIGQQMLLTVTSANTYDLLLPTGETIQGEIGQTTSNEGVGLQMRISRISAPSGVQFVVEKTDFFRAVGNIRQSLRIVEKGRKSNLLQLTMTHSKKAVAVAILDNILSAYVEQNIGRSSEAAERSLDFLNTQMPLVLDDLTSAENELNEFRLENGSINLDLESAAVLERLIALDTQLSELALEETEISRLFTKDHPRYASLIARRNRLSDEKANLSASVQSFPDTQQEILRRTRNVEVNQQIYLQLLNKKQELNVIKASAIGSVRVIDSALGLPSPVSPKRLPLMLVFSFLAVFMGSAALLLRYFLTRNVDSPDDITKLGLAVYATLPKSGSQERKSSATHVVSRDNPAELTVEALRSLRTSLHFGMLENGKGVVSVTGPAPSIGKTFVSTNLAYLAAESGSRVLLIDADLRRGTVGSVYGLTKDRAGFSEFLAGKASYEEVVQQVSLLERSALGVYQAQSVSSREPELEAVLEGIQTLNLSDSSLGGAGEQVGSGQSGGSLSVIPRGKAPPNPSELLMQGRLPRFLKEMSDEFDLIVIDTPPVLAATDSMIVGRYADMNLMVVRHGQTAIHEIEEAARSFTLNKVNLCGVVLNDYDQRKGKLGQYGYTYGYQYTYESE